MNARQAVRETGWGAVTTIVTAALCFVAFMSIQALSYLVPGDRIEAHLRTAFETGDLQLAYSRPHDSDLGYHQRNDCLIYWMAISRPARIGEYLASGQFTGDPTGRATYCETLRDRLFADPIPHYVSGNYLRYLHGYRPVTIFALSIVDVPGMRLLFKGICYGLLLTVAVSAARVIFTTADEMARLRAWAGLNLSIAFGAFYGLDYFGQSPSHAPAAWVLFLFLLIATQRDLMALPRRWFFALTACFGALIAFFEYLTGAAIVGLALLLGTMAVQGRRDVPPGALLLRSVLGVCSFVGAILLSFAINVGVNSWYFGLKNLFKFFEALATRMGATAHVASGTAVEGTTVAVGATDVFHALLDKLDFLTHGDPVVAQLLFIGCGFTIASLAMVGFLNARGMQEVIRVLLVLCSVAVVALWYLAFKNHSVLHAAFMVRVLVWIPAAALLLAALVFALLWPSSQAASASRALPSESGGA